MLRNIDLDGKTYDMNRYGVVFRHTPGGFYGGKFDFPERAECDLVQNWVRSNGGFIKRRDSRKNWSDVVWDLTQPRKVLRAMSNRSAADAVQTESHS